MHVEVVDSLHAVPAADWDALTPPDHPFTDHAFLLAFEDSGSVGPTAGWVSKHIILRDGGSIVGAVPCYLKSHSYGEYIFDWGWARGAMDAGISYYPKLVVAAPFTPASGRRFLTHPAADRGLVIGRLAGALQELARAERASSIHALFCSAEEKDLLVSGGEWLGRLTYQFHWENKLAWRHFDDYLEALRSPSRKQVRKERRRAAEQGFKLVTLEGNQLEPRHWAAIETFYLDTVSRKGAIPYLRPGFFSRIRETFAGSVVASFAEDENGEPVASSLAFRKGGAIYGRYWGTCTESEFLHFELCYYQLIEYALENGVTRFEAGAQGEHKLKRGLLPAPTHSVHWIAHAGLREAIADFLPREAAAVEAEMRHYLEHSPYKRT